MEVVKSVEAYKTIEGKFRFSYLHLVFRENDQLYIAKSPTRQPNRSDLWQISFIDTKNRGPAMRSTWTELRQPNEDHHIKTPDLLAYSKSDLDQEITQEIEICEQLMNHRHPNIAVYLGCLTASGRVTGIGYVRYKTTLLEEYNPRRLSKSEFLSRGRPTVDTAMAEKCLDGILAGIRHLHSLDIIHNDITPANIMLDANSMPVVIDFDSCRRSGESLENTKRTHGWHNPDVKIASEKNDLDGWPELRTWLLGSSTTEFLFKGG